MNTLATRPASIPPTGICKIEYLSMLDVYTISLKYPDTDMVEIIPKTGKSWSEIYFTPKTVKISHNPEDTPAGEIHTYNIEHHIPYNRLEAAQKLTLLRGRQYFLRLSFVNGNSRIFGETGNGIEIKIKELPGINQPNPDGYNIIWYGTFSRPAPYDYTVHATEESGSPSGSPSLSLI